MTDISNEKMDDKTHSELLNVFNATISDISFFKTQQWKALNYIALIYVGIVGVAKIFRDEEAFSTDLFSVLFLVSFGVFLAGLHVLSELESSLKSKRARLERIVKEFSKKIQDDIYQDMAQPHEKVTLIYLHYLILVLAFMAVAWVLLLWKHCI